MNSLPNQTNVPANGPDQIIVSILLAKTTTLTSTAENSTAHELPLEKAMHHRAEAMTEVLTEIMDRPLTPRFWGLNE